MSTVPNSQLLTISQRQKVSSPALELFRDLYVNLRFTLIATVTIGLGVSLAGLAFQQFQNQVRSGNFNVAESLASTFATVFFISGVLLVFGVTSIASSRGVGFPRQQFLLPKKTSYLVFVRLLACCVGAAGAYLLVSLTANLLMRQCFPVIAPTMTLMAMVCLSCGFAWTFRDRNALRIGLYILLIPATLIIGVVCSTYEFTIYFHGWDQANRYDRSIGINLAILCWMMASILVGAVIVAIEGVHKQRIGKVTPWSAIQLSDRVSSIARPVQVKSFTSTFSASFWYETKSRAWVIPAIFLPIILLLMVVTVPFLDLSGTNSGNLFGSTVLVSIAVMTTVMSLGIGVVYGSRRQGRRLGLRTFNSVLPVSDRELAMPIIVSSAISLAGFIAIPAFILSLLHTMNPMYPNFSVMVFTGLVWLPILWMMAGNLIAALLSGRGWIIGFGLVAVEMTWMISVLLTIFFSATVCGIVFTTSSIILAIVGLYLVISAMTKGLLSPSVFGLSVLAFVVMATAVLVNLPMHMKGGFRFSSYSELRSICNAVILISLASWVLTPAATIPLAIRANRRR